MSLKEDHLDLFARVTDCSFLCTVSITDHGTHDLLVSVLTIEGIVEGFPVGCDTIKRFDILMSQPQCLLAGRTVMRRLQLTCRADTSSG